MEDEEKILIEVLQDGLANVSEKDDAAMDLSEYDSPEVIQALISKGSDDHEDPVVLNSCGESLAEIWLRKDFFDKRVFDSLHPGTKQGFLFFIESTKPGWRKLELPLSEEE